MSSDGLRVDHIRDCKGCVVLHKLLDIIFTFNSFNLITVFFDSAGVDTVLSRVYILTV